MKNTKCLLVTITAMLLMVSDTKGENFGERKLDISGEKMAEIIEDIKYYDPYYNCYKSEHEFKGGLVNSSRAKRNTNNDISVANVFLNSKAYYMNSHDKLVDYHNASGIDWITNLVHFNKNLPACSDDEISNVKEFTKFDTSLCTSYSFIVGLRNDHLCSSLLYCPEDKVYDSTGSCVENVKCSKKSVILGNFFECQKYDTDKFVNKFFSNEFCELNGFEISPCGDNFIERTVNLQWFMTEEGVKVTNNAHMISKSRSTFIDNYKCDGECSIGDCSLGGCNGDPSYCSFVKCDTKSKCSCYRKRDKFSFILDGVTETPMCWGSLDFNTKRVISKQLIRRESKKVKSVCSKGVVFHQESSILDFTMIICNELRCGGSSTENGELEYRLDTSIIDSDDPNLMLKVLNSNSNELIRTVSLQCINTKFCGLISCYLCVEKLINYSCLTVSDKFIVLVASVVLIVLFLNILFLVVYCVKCLLKIVLYLFKNMGVCVQKKKKNGEYRKVMNKESENYKEDSNSENDQEEVELKPIRKSGFGKKATLFLTISGVSALCSNSKTISVSDRECVENNGKLTCNVFYDESLSFTNLKMTHCLLIQHNSRGIIDLLKISLQRVYQESELKILYFAPRYSVRKVVSVRCPAYGVCDIPTCNAFDSNKDNSYYLWPSSVMSKGKSHCTKSDIPVSDSYCFIALGAYCAFYRNYLVNDEKIVTEVNSLSNQVGKALVRITNGNKEELFYTDTNGASNSTMTLSSKLTHISSHMHSYECALVERQANRLYSLKVGNCNKQSKVEGFNIGSVQCPTAIDAEELTNRCLSKEFDYGLPEREGNFIIKNYGYNDEDGYKVNLPEYGHDFITKFENNKVVTESLDNFSVKIDIKIKAEQVSKYIDTGSCKIKFIDLKGCYNCTAGAKLTIEAESQVSGSKGYFNCEISNIHESLTLNNDRTQYVIDLFTDESFVDEECSLRCPLLGQNIRMKGFLDHYTPLSSIIMPDFSDNIPVKTNDNINSNSTRSESDLMSNFNSLFMIIKGIVKSVKMEIIISLATLILLKIVFNCLFKRNDKLKTN